MAWWYAYIKMNFVEHVLGESAGRKIELSLSQEDVEGNMV